MYRKTRWMFALGLLLLLGLSGCYSQRYEVRHNPDGTGHFMIETVFGREMLSLMEEDMTSDEARDELLRDGVLGKDDLFSGDPNITAVTERDFVDSSTGALHHRLEVEIRNILIPLQLDQADDYSKPFMIDDYGDGVYLFSAVVESLSEFIGEEMGAMDLDLDETRQLLEGSTVNWQIHVGTFIEGDPRAVYDPAAGVVRWEVPMYDALFADEPIQIFAIYRLDVPDAVQPEVIQDEISVPPRVITEPEPPGAQGGLPNWLPAALIGVLCLGLIFVVVVVVVIILVVRKRKSP